MLRAVVVSLSLLLVGCLQDEPTAGDRLPAEGADEGPPAGTQDIAWSMGGCRFANVFVGATEAAMAPYLPEGFELAGAPPLADLPGVWETYLGYEIFLCERGTTLNGTDSPYVHGGYFTSVLPPASLRPAEATAHYLRILNVVNDDRYRPWAELGFPVARGTGTFEDAPDSAVVRVQGDIDGDGVVSYVITGDEQGGGEGDWFAEYMLSARSVAVWSADYTVHSLRSGPATVTFPAGSIGAAVVGTLPQPAAAITGFWDFHDGRVTWTAAGQDLP